MKISPVKDFESKKNPHNVDSRVVYSTEKAMVVHIMLKPGEALRRHITPVDVAFYVLEGRGTIEIGDEKAEARPDTVVESPARIPHRWINNGPGNLRVLVMKLPRPNEDTIVL